MLDHAALHALLRAKPSALASQPFGPGVDVYKVGGRMFAIVAAPPERRFTLKCDPVLGEIVRGQYAAITPGYHTDKRHWISIVQDADLPDAEIVRLIDHAYDQALARLTRAARAALGAAERAV